MHLDPVGPGRGEAGVVAGVDREVDRVAVGGRDRRVIAQRVADVLHVDDDLITAVVRGPGSAQIDLIPGRSTVPRLSEDVGPGLVPPDEIGADVQLPAIEDEGVVAVDGDLVLRRLRQNIADDADRAAVPIVIQVDEFVGLHDPRRIVRVVQRELQVIDRLPNGVDFDTVRPGLSDVDEGGDVGCAHLDAHRRLQVGVVVVEGGHVEL